MLSDTLWSIKYKSRQLDTFGGLLRAFLDHYAVLLYQGIVLAALVGFFLFYGNLAVLLSATLITAIFYPLIEYSLHRFVLHSHFLYKNPYTASA